MAGIGEALRSTRERRGLSIDQVAQDTRISPRFLEALEGEQFDELPAPVYVRGFLRSYANYLHLEPQPLLDQLIGGDLAAPGARQGYVGANGRGGHQRRNDPFQRGAVATAAAPDPSRPSAVPADDEGWAPEPLAPFSPVPVDHGYIPGSDLMEAPEHPPEPHGYLEAEPVFQRRTAGVLAERPVGPGEPGVSRKIALFGGGVAAVLAFLLVAVVLTRGDGDGDNKAAATAGETPGVTPGNVLIVGTPTVATSTTVSPSASAVASGTPADSASTTPAPGTTTPRPTNGPGTVSTSTPTPTPNATAEPSPTPTSIPPTFTPTRVPRIVPSGLGFSECTPNGSGSADCGAPPYRVICFAPIDPSLNQNWWVDVNWDFGEVPTHLGWRETVVTIAGLGKINTAGADGCP